jgi:uncharacterized membrane protein YgcG
MGGIISRGTWKTMKIFAALGMALVALTMNLAPAVARDRYVIDNAGLFSATAVDTTNARIADFNAQTGKEVVVYTTPSLDGATADSAAERLFAQEQINGILIFISKTPKKIGVFPDRASRSFFPSGSTSAIRDAIAASFNDGNYDKGLETGVSLTVNMYRSHLPSRGVMTAPVTEHRQSGGFSMGWIFLFLIIVVAFLVLRAIMRALFTPRMPMGGPMNAGPMGGPGYGPGYGAGPGYGYGPGWGGGGGGFWSGLLGGLGGAWLGNEIFGQHNIGGAGFGSAGFGGTDVGGGNQPDTSGFQSDPGQIDMGNASSGDWGGGGDSGGWGGGDSGGGFGGGGDSGGGW